MREWGTGWRRRVRWSVVLFLVSCSPGGDSVREGAAGHDASPYVGRYLLDEDLVLDVREEAGVLGVLPSFWRTRLTLDPVAPDTFVSLLHREIHFAFERGDAGEAASLSVWGHPRGEIEGDAVRLPPGTRVPVEALLAGDPDGAIELLRNAGALADVERITRLGFELARRFPSRGRTAAEFLEASFPSGAYDSDAYVAAGLGWMQAGERARARLSFERALELAPDDVGTRDLARVLGSPRAGPPPESAWTLPFDLEALFADPSAEEVTAVRADWRERELGPRDVDVVARHTYRAAGGLAETGPVTFDVFVIRHRVHGSMHVGAALVPRNAGPDCCPILLEAHGIDWRYSGLDLDEIEAPAILGDAARDVVILVPGFRGEELRVDTTTYRSEGDPRDGWDGATDDAIAFLGAALDALPNVVPSGICAFGKSRGGTVAMLASLRDDRISCLVAWTGPADWFHTMGTFGFSLEEQLRLALWERWKPGEGWGSAAQVIDRDLTGALNASSADFPAIRRRMLAASPAYFVESLPEAELHYGREDGSVGVANADAMRRRLRTRGSAPFRVIVHEGAGHDMPYPLAYRQSRAFLVDRLRLPD